MQPASQPPIIELRSVSRTFGSGSRTVRALSGVSLSIRPDEIVALVGESGSGKSTLGRVALGLIQPESGSVLLKGRDIAEMTAAEYRRARTAVQPIFQDSYGSLNPRRTILSALHQAAPGSTMAEKIELLRSVGLSPPERFLSRYPHELSGGQRQRFSIARALSVAPELVIADEPLSGADVSIRGQVLNVLTELAADRKTAYLMITHDISIARVFAHRVLVMHKGSIVEEGPAQAVLDNPQQEYTKQLVAATPDLGKILRLLHNDEKSLIERSSAL